MIYLIANPARKTCKIGYTAQSAQARLMALQTGCSDELELLYVIEGTQQAEKQLHSAFGDLHVRGEWFRLTSELKAYFRKRAICLQSPQGISNKEDGSVYMAVFSAENQLFNRLTHIGEAHLLNHIVASTIETKGLWYNHEANVQYASEQLNLSSATIYRYIRLLTAKEVLIKGKRSEYQVNPRYFSYDK